MTGFAGFPLIGLDFYEDLEADNSKAFWTANKETYERAVKQPMTALVADLEPAFGSAKIFRPYRDVRFAKDKSPYKTAQGAVVRAAPGVGWYVQIGAAGLYIGGGFYQGSPTSSRSCAPLSMTTCADPSWRRFSGNWPRRASRSAARS